MSAMGILYSLELHLISWRMPFQKIGKDQISPLYAFHIKEWVLVGTEPELYSTVEFIGLLGASAGVDCWSSETAVKHALLE